MVAAPGGGRLLEVDFKALLLILATVSVSPTRQALDESQPLDQLDSLLFGHLSVGIEWRTRLREGEREREREREGGREGGNNKGGVLMHQIAMMIA